MNEMSDCVSPWKKLARIARSLLVLFILILWTGCANYPVNDCPPFPVPSAHVADVLRDVSREDREVWAWFNQLVDLCQQLGDCQADED